jgi:septum formation protein
MRDRPATRTLVLASASPRRREILTCAGIPFAVRTAPVSEAHDGSEAPADLARRLAVEKACAVPCADDEIILAADTVVVLEGQILGKPVDAADAARMLGMLSGREHEVITGICLRHAGGVIVDHESTRVRFAPLSPEEIDAYVATGEPADKAGAYAIQGRACRFIERIEGCYFNVVGLPVALVYRHLKALAPPGLL